MMGKKVVLTGPTCSGKTTVAKVLIERYGFRPVVGYTTRPMRPGEVDGIDYHFISLEKFEEMMDQGLFEEVISYNASFGFCRYGSLKKDWHSVNNLVSILTPEGIANLSVATLNVWMDIPENDIRRRAIQRGDNLEEVERRLRTDQELFKDFKHSFDYIFRFTDPDLSPDIIAKMVYEFADSHDLHML